MNNKEILGRYCQSFDTIITSVIYDGYKYLKKITGIVNSILMEDTVKFDILKQGNTTPFRFNLKKFMTFIEHEDL